MTANSPASPQKPKERRNSFTEVSDAEKQLWTRIHSQGLLHNDVKYLYHKACCIYENLFLRDNELPELQNIEYLLWRLHYKHIDEFRKRILLSSSKEDGKSSTNRKWIVDAHLDGFKMFLSGASKFYEDLIRKIKRYYGLVEEPWFYNNDGESGRIEQTKLHKCQFVCHRLCICIGDLARYSELYEKSKNEDRNWSVAASYYFESAKIYPDGGNPQNQLAVLATYIGDEFLALYHCIRSLAVKEPFPDALQNLILLFERNRSCNIGSLKIEAHNLSESSNSNGAHETGGSFKGTTVQASEHSQISTVDLLLLFIRTTSFFFLDTSLDSFPCTSTSFLRELEALLALDVSKLSSEFESYQSMNMLKSGPYRALHIISVLLFIIHNLSKETKPSILKRNNEEQQSVLMKLALTFTFNCMGRFADRCLKGSPVIYFPLLPALLVFVEWLVHAIDKVHIEDENCDRAVSYFFSSLVKLLNHLQENRAPVPFNIHIALWEDYELRGFVPLSSTKASLDFSTHWEEQINYKMKNEYRAYRIVQAATKIANNLEKRARKWLIYSEKDMKFRTIEGKHSNAVDEEEDIVFKPITRRKSEPIPPLKGQQMQASSSDDHLRRASSLLVAQNRALIDSLTSQTTVLSPISCEQLVQDEPSPKSSPIPSTFYDGPIAAGPPSLSSWVLNGDKLWGARAKNKEVDRNVLKPIEEMDSGEQRCFSISNDETSCVSTYCSPVPSAPLYPDNAVWFEHISAGFPLHNAATQHQPAYSPPPLLSGDAYNQGNPHIPNLGSYSFQQDHHSYYTADFSKLDLLDGWSYNHPWATSSTTYIERSPPLLHPSSPLLRGLHAQRESPASSPPLVDMRPEPQPLLQYLKQREWQLQQETQYAGLPFLRN